MRLNFLESLTKGEWDQDKHEIFWTSVDRIRNYVNTKNCSTTLNTIVLFFSDLFLGM